jgi:hypothetical protein
MEAIRNIQTVTNGEVHLQLPLQFWGQEVEIIVLPAPRSTAPSSPHKRSLRGSLKPYARPELIAAEQDAWQAAAGEKHEAVS